MSFLFQDFFSVFGVDYFRGRLNMLTETLLRQFVVSMSDSTCTTEALESCRDDSAALKLKLVAIASILAAGAAGIALPLIGRKRSFLATDSNLFVAAKAFAAGVILATGFVHMLPDGASNLSDPCLPTYPWSKFPFSSFFAMISALITLLADFVGTQLYERKQKRLNQAPPTVVAPVERAEGKVFGEEEDGGMHIVGMRAHAAHHQHTHPDGDRCGGGEAREGHVAREYEEDDVEEGAHAHGHSHSHGFGDSVGEGNARHVVVSQVLELGIVSHSVIIGLSLGVSHSPCTIRPLVAALSFHQFFEGFALGGCISQAQFKKLSTILMACFFAITTPAGISIGIGIASSYNPSSARALVIEGILDSLSAGILVYMALVDLIAADFMSRRMRCNARLQIVSYLALFTGAVLMSALAIWS